MTITSHEAPRPWRSRFARLHPKAYLGVHGVVGILAAMALVWLFAAIADEIPEQSTLAHVDQSILHWLEGHGTEPGESIFTVVSWLGAPALAACIVVALVYFIVRHDWLRAAALATVTGGGLLLSNVLKLVFHRGRPETAVEFITRHTWSFPSGHALNSLVGYGFLAALLLERTPDRRKRIAIVATAALLALVVGYSRLYLGVHYFSDVVGGWVAGAVWLIVCVTGYDVVRRRARGATASA